MGDLLLPALILVIIGMVGVSVWLALFLNRGRRGSTSPGEQRSRRSSDRGGSDALVSVGQDARGVWRVWVYGEPYKTLDEVPGAAVQQEVVNAVRILAAFSRDYITRQRKESARAPEAPTPETTPASSSASSSPPPSFFERKEERLHRPGAPSLMPEINLAKEINEILEVLQRQRPSLAGRSIRLQNTPGGGVRFWVDNAVYDAVDEIPDPQVQALIRAATQEWERR